MLGTFCMGAGTVSAQTAAPPAPPTPPPIAAPADTPDLAALEAAARAGKREQIEGWLRAGQPDAFADRAIELLGELRKAPSLPLLARLRRHRRESARALAYRALSLQPGRDVWQLVASGLRDPSPRVRGVAAEALASMGARQALPLLWVALERGVPQAAGAVGRLGGAPSIDKLHAQLGRLPLRSLLQGYRELLPRADLPVPARLGIVTRLEDVSGPLVQAFFEQHLAAGAPRLAAELRKEMERALARVRAGGRAQ